MQRTLLALFFFAISLLFGLGHRSYAAPTLDILPNTQQHLLNEHLYFLEDPSRSLSFEDIRNGHYQSEFKPIKEMPSQAVTRSFIWLKASINFAYTDIDNWLLQFDYCPIEKLTLYTPSSDGSYHTTQTGNLVPVDQRSLLDRHFLFPIKALHDQPMEIYLKIETKGPVLINTQILTNEQKRLTQRFENRMLGIIYGILLAMIIYNLFIYFSIKDKRYLYYVLYISSATGGFSAHDGSFQEMFSPLSLWWSHNAIYFTVCVGVFFGSLFVRHFLELKRCAPKVNNSFIGLQATCLIFIPLGFVFDNFHMTFMATFVTWGFCVLAFFAGVMGIRQNVRTGRYFILAWSALIFGIFLAGLRYLGIVPALPFTNYFVHFGAVIEVTLLSFALADRINQIQEEKDAIQKQANLNLKQTNTQLEQSMQLKNSFLTAVSHELRTPMNGIIGSTDLLSESHTDEERIQYVNDIYRSSRQMMALVENILDFTEAEAGEFKPYNKDFSLQELLEPLEVLFKGKAHRKGISFISELPKREKSFQENLYNGDPKIIQKILSQILANAVKFTNEGSISISIQITPDKRSHSKSQISFIVKDTGIGMDPSKLDEVFNAFQQGDGSYKRKYEGLGIGLSLARTLARKINSQITASSSPGEGSTFTLTTLLPKSGKRKVANTTKGQLSAFKSAKHLKPSTDTQIMVVEDNPVNLKVINKMIEKNGYSTITAMNGQEALELLTDFKVSLILMDCQMPVMDGFEATRAIRQMENGNQTVPIVAVTANTMSEDEALCYEAGMNGFIPKPINQKTISLTLDKWLNH